jgi:hypothetical protein
LAFIEPSIGSITTRTPSSPKSTTPRSSETAVKRAPLSCRRSSSAKTRSSACWSITSVWSPPSPVVPVSITRSRLVGCSRMTSRSPATALRQAPSQSACISAGEVAISAIS